MKATKLIALGVLMLSSLSIEAQTPKTELIPVGIPWTPMGISPNGRFICGSRQYEEVYIFDIEAKKLQKIPCSSGKSQLVLFDVANDGTAVGKTDNGEPAVIKDGEWSLLPIPAPLFGDASAVWMVNSDASKVLGQVAVKPDSSKPFKVIPCLWSRNSDGTYTFEPLPVPDNMIEGEPQFVSPRQISEDGNTIAGFVVSKMGKYYQQIIYERQADGTWSYTIPFLSIYCDMSKYDEVYKKKPNMKDIVKAKPGTKEYFEQIEEFQKAEAKWDYEMKTIWLTGKEVNTLPVVMSENGQYIASAWVEKSYKYTEGDMSVQMSLTYYPVVYDIKKKTFTHYKSLKQHAPIRVTNDGMMMASDNKIVFVIEPNKPDQAQPLPQWLKSKYNFDIMAKLPSRTDYMKDPIINGSGNAIACKYIVSKKGGGLELQDVFCLRLQGDVSIDQVQQAISLEVHPNPTKDLVQVEGARALSQLSIISMQGETLVHKQADVTGSATIDLSTLPAGLYVLRAEGSKGIVIKKQ